MLGKLFGLCAFSGALFTSYQSIIKYHHVGQTVSFKRDKLIELGKRTHESALKTFTLLKVDNAANQADMMVIFNRFVFTQDEYENYPELYNAISSIRSRSSIVNSSNFVSSIFSKTYFATDRRMIVDDINPIASKLKMFIYELNINYSSDFVSRAISPYEMRYNHPYNKIHTCASNVTENDFYEIVGWRVAIDILEKQKKFRSYGDKLNGIFKTVIDGIIKAHAQPML